MRKIIVIYKSKYGAAKEYAELLEQKLQCTTLDLNQVKPAQLAPYDTVVLCGGIYAGGIAGTSFLNKNQDVINGKDIILFAVGASPYDDNAVDMLKQRHLKGPLESCPLFYGRGKWNETVMSFRDRTLCKLLQKAVAKKGPEVLEPWEAALVTAAGETRDWVDEKYLLPLLNYLEHA